MRIFSTLEPQQRKNLLLLFTVGILFWSSNSSLLATLPLYIEDVGGTRQQVGLVMGAFAVGGILSRPWLGKLADRRSRKLVILIGMGVVVTAPLGYFFTQSILLLLSIRAFHGISVAAYAPGNNALIVDWSPAHQRGEVIGYMSMSNPIGMSVGPAIAGFLQAQVGYPPLFLFSFGLGLVGFLFACQVKVPSQVHQVNRQNSDLKAHNQFWKLLDSPRFLTPTLVLLLTGLVYGAVTTFIPVYLKQTKLDLNVGWFYTAAALSSFSIRFLVGYASDRLGRGLFITSSLVCYALGSLLLSIAGNTFDFLLAGFFEGAGGGTLIPLMLVLLADRSSPSERGRVFSLCLGGFDLGLAISGPVFGAFAEKLGYRGIFSLTLGLAMLALITFITRNGKNLSHSLRFATGRSRDSYVLNELS